MAVTYFISHQSVWIVAVKAWWHLAAHHGRLFAKFGQQVPKKIIPVYVEVCFLAVVYTKCLGLKVPNEHLNWCTRGFTRHNDSLSLVRQSHFKAGDSEGKWNPLYRIAYVLFFFTPPYSLQNRFPIPHAGVKPICLHYAAIYSRNVHIRGKKRNGRLHMYNLELGYWKTGLSGNLRVENGDVRISGIFACRRRIDTETGFSIDYEILAWEWGLIIITIARLP